MASLLRKLAARGTFAILVAVVAACGGPAEPTAVGDPYQKAFFAQALAEAKAGGANAEQLEVLESAATSGELTGAMVEPMLSPFFDCLAGHGMQGEVDGVIELEAGVTIPSYTVAFPAGVDDMEEIMTTWDPLQLACEDEHLTFAWKALQLQPVRREAWDQDFANRRPAIVTCIRESGQSIDDMASDAELIDATVIVLEQSGKRCLDAR